MRTQASAPRTGVYVICTRNVRRTGRAGRSRAQVDLFADAHLVSSPAETKLCRQPMPDSDSMEKLKSKQRLEQAMEWLNAESN